MSLDSQSLNGKKTETVMTRGNRKSPKESLSIESVSLKVVYDTLLALIVVWNRLLFQVARKRDVEQTAYIFPFFCVNALFSRRLLTFLVFSSVFSLEL